MFCIVYLSYRSAASVSVCYFVLSSHPVVCEIVSGLSGCASGSPLVEISARVVQMQCKVTNHVDVTCGGAIRFNSASRSESDKKAQKK